MRFYSLEQMRDMLDQIVVDEVIPVSQEEIDWYKNRLDGLSIEMRAKMGRDLKRPKFHGYELVLKKHV